jgi:hypothetical protein
MVCGLPPAGRARWTVRRITEAVIERAIAAQVGRETIRVRLQSHELKPWREKMWSIPELDDEFVDRMEDRLDLYERPLDPK